MPVVASPRTARATEFRMRQWTRSARKQFQALTPKHQNEVAEHIAEAIPAYLCRPVYGRLSRFKVYHFHASETLVVSYVLRGSGEGCVVHIGTHPEFDHFAMHYTGLSPEQIIHIDENDMQKKPSMNGYAQKAVPTLPVTRPLVATVTPPPVQPVDPLKLALLDLLKPVVTKETESFADDLLKVIGRLDGYAKQLDIVQTTVAAHIQSTEKDRTTEQIAEVAALVAALRLDTDKATTEANERYEKYFGDFEQRLADQAKAFESQVAWLAAAVEGIRTMDHTLVVRPILEAVRLQAEAAHHLLAQQAEQISAAEAREQAMAMRIGELGRSVDLEKSARLAVEAELTSLATAVATIKSDLGAQVEEKIRQAANRPFARFWTAVSTKLGLLFRWSVTVG